jgi:predicted Rossmann fold flavoprotein
MVVVGAGPAGLMAAIAAASCGRRVAIIERMPKPGLKLLASGGGRCNLTNTLEPERFMAAFGRNGRFMEPALEAMSAAALRQFLEKLGVPTHAPDGFHVFPAVEKSEVVLSALRRRCDDAGVVWRLGERVARLRFEAGRVAGVETESGETLRAAAVILATGGKTYPQLSGSDFGYELAKQAGHKITALYGVLVQLVTRERWPTECAGVTLKDAEVWRADRPRQKFRGGVVFTHDGLSGPPILDMSREAVPRLENEGAVPIRLRAVRADWKACFDAWRQTRGRKTVTALLDEHMPASLALVLVREAGIAADQTAAQLGKDGQQRLIQLLEAAPLTVVGSGGDARAMATRGGVSLKEVNPKTLESRLARGLFLAGEVLDLDGPCGGFNLQWAFSSGWLAGTSAAAQGHAS